MDSKTRLIIGISGSSGFIYAIRLLQALQQMPIETHLVVSKAAQLTRTYETNLSLAELKTLAHVYYSSTDLAANIASGSFKTLGMIIIPCSMNTLGHIAQGLSNNLLTRAADVVLKERRKLVLVPRETPLHLMHLNNMLTVTQMGGIIAPPVPTFYNQPQSLEDLVDNSVGRILDLFDLENSLVQRWNKP